MERDDSWTASAALSDSSFQDLIRIAAAASLRDGIEIQEIGSKWLRVHPVWRKFHEVDAARGEDIPVFFEKEADVAALGKMRADPGFKGSVHLAEPLFGGEVIVGEHEVTMLSDECGVAYRGAADGGHLLILMAAALD